MEHRKSPVAIACERKQVTALFSDLSGYTAMAERLDPEEVQEIVTLIFGEIAQSVIKYEGFVENFIGDAIMALFGIPKAHEDDPVRAIQAAKEIHELVEAMSPRLERKIGHHLAMHSGINTGLVVIGQVDLGKGTHGVLGDTINTASRLSDLAKAGEILVGPTTYRQTERYFTFESLPPVAVRGKTEPVQIYRVVSPKGRHREINRVSGCRANLIGRAEELAGLGRAAERLRTGVGTVFSICGDAGTGKSRLVQEFRATLDPKSTVWLEAHSYACSQSIPYSPLMDLLNRLWRIEEDDSVDLVKEKIESGLTRLLGKEEVVSPYIGSLYTLSYPEAERLSPELWKSRLFGAVQAMLVALTQRWQVVICLEDLHWADTSFLELLRWLLSEFAYPAIILCVYRLPFSLFKHDSRRWTEMVHHEMRLQDLSRWETQVMLESLLKSKNIPGDLRDFMDAKVDGNPFYLEEVVNSLIEAEILTPKNGGWRLTRSLVQSDIPPTVQGVISARLDRLEKRMKRILQEASVIGRSFLLEILRKVTEFEENLDHCVSDLEQVDLIRAQLQQTELEYEFKHALTQEVAYGGLLKKERNSIHDRIARVMEGVFHDRLSEFYETLAFHYKQGRSIRKAVDYLVRSGEKSLKRYAVETSHRYFEEAFELIMSNRESFERDPDLLIDLLIKWSSVYYYRGDFKGLLDLLTAHKGVVKSFADVDRLGMFYAWLSCGLWHRERFQEAYHYLTKALTLGEKTGNQQVIGYACAWLSWTCSDLGLLEEAINFAERAQEIHRLGKTDEYIYLSSLAGKGYAHWHKGEKHRVLEAGKGLLEFGEKHSNIRSTVMGHCCMGFSNLVNGDLAAATACFKQAEQISVDPWYSQFPQLALCYTYITRGEPHKAREALEEIIRFSKERGADYAGGPAHSLMGVVLIAQGHLSRGIRILETRQKTWLESGHRLRYIIFGHILAKIYARIAQDSYPMKLTHIGKNLGFLLRKAPFATRKALGWYEASIETAAEIGAKNILGKSYYDLGLFHAARGKKAQARDCLSRAIEIFEQGYAELYLKDAEEAMKALKS
ncbi:MAG: AAA family ATPase [Deltaproteobacteria bacterium]|nr:MAG: AAA family ATPase [Deltaproteobacteria bacterium]